MTNVVFLWEDTTGVRKWEAIEEDQVSGFTKKLLSEGVNPATIMMGYSPILFHWVFKEYHNGLSDVFFQKIDKDIYGTGYSEPTQHTPVDVPRKARKPKPDSKFGWIAPDGRYFRCNYSEHSDLARRIVGELESVFDAERHLEDLGWAKVFRGPDTEYRYTVGMGENKKLTNDQIKTLEQEGLSSAFGVELWL